MNGSLPHDLGSAADQLTRFVEGVREDDLGSPTPCADWSVEELLAHILDLSEAFTAAAVGTGRLREPSGISRPR